MPTKRANVLSERDISEALAYVDVNSAQPERDRLLVLLTCRLGLRSQEAAKLYAEDILDSRGDLKDSFFVSKRAAKYGKARTLPMHPQVRKELKNYLTTFPTSSGPIFVNQWGKELSPNAVQQQLTRIYERIGLKGCSSHSGRRTFGTRAAKKVSEFGGTLRDVQKLLGHSNIATTEIYIEYTARDKELVCSL